MFYNRVNLLKKPNSLENVQVRTQPKLKRIPEAGYQIETATKRFVVVAILLFSSISLMAQSSQDHRKQIHA
jgi:hypothetical protein